MTSKSNKLTKTLTNTNIYNSRSAWTKIKTNQGLKPSNLTYGDNNMRSIKGN